MNALAGLLDMSVSKLYEFSESSDTYYLLHEKIDKPDGTSRYIYNVREPLKAMLRRVNAIFAHRCQFPDYLTGSLPGWSYVKNAELHAGQGTVIAIDASNFFPSVKQSMVEEVWRQFYGCDETVSILLADLCCYQGALAQGSPPSSYLANLAFWNIEPLIVGEFKRRGYVYSRYVDDIIVSHSRRLTRPEKSWAICSAKKVFLSRDLKVKARKTKVMDRNVRQEVHKRSVNAGRVCAPRNLKNQLRAEVNRFSEGLKSGPRNMTQPDQQYAKIRSRILHLKQFNRSAAEKLLDKLESAYSGR